MEFKKVLENGQQLYEVDLGKDTFYMDVVNWEFREKNDPLNVFSFRDMLYWKGVYMLDYNQKFKTSVLNVCGSQKEDVLKFEFKDMVSLHPDAVSQRFGIPIEKLPDKDEHLVCSQERIQRRINAGILPEVMIGNDRMFADSRLMELRCTEYSLWINMEGLEINRLGNKMFFFYHQKVKTVYHVPKHLTELPKDVVMVTLPLSAELDPVGQARREGACRWVGSELVRDLYYTDAYPIRDIVAGVYPLSQSPLIKHIEHCKRLEQNVTNNHRRGKGFKT